MKKYIGPVCYFKFNEIHLSWKFSVIVEYMTSFLKLITFKVVVRELYKILDSYFTLLLIMRHFEIDVCIFGHLITDFYHP